MFPTRGAARKCQAIGVSLSVLALTAVTCLMARTRPAFAQTTDATASPTSKRIIAQRINPHPPKIDGKLDDGIWRSAEFASDFTQKEPNQGVAARHRSEVAFVYDDDALYVGARMYCLNPDGIISTVARRDNAGTSERIIVSLDTYHDKRTAYSLAVTASGVRTDYYHPTDHETNRYYDWDPVWEAQTSRDAQGWTAEMRIPFTQLRFRNNDVQVWGINMNRWVPTGNEDSYWIVVPKDQTGWSSRMGELVGIEGIKPSRRVEFMPYVAGDALFNKGDVHPDDPFHDGSEFEGRAGADFKMGVGPNLTLEGTINPDFGQVEADPAVVNLSAFETVFGERRPFFLEGGQLLSGGGASYFYSRRIGARPRYTPAGDFLSTPKSTSILGAAKLSGRLDSGLKVGVLGAFSQEEKADVYLDDAFKQVTVEPATGYGVVRLQQELGSSGSTGGIILTGIERDLEKGGALDAMVRSRAVTGGTDWNLKFKEGTYQLGADAGFSYVEGSPQAILGTQQSSARYFQRPDADYVDVDTSATSLAGVKSSLWFEKNGGKHWHWGLGTGAESPGFEINDTGQLNTADDLDGWSWVRYQENTPSSLFQNWSLYAGSGAGWNFGAVHQYSYFDLESRWTWKNYTGSFLGVEYYPRAQSDNLTRGGPLMETNRNWNVRGEVWSSAQNKTTWSVWGGYGAGELGGWWTELGGGVTFRPGARWQLSFNPRMLQSVSSRQYIDTYPDSTAVYGERYIFSFIERSELVLVGRLNFAFTPDMTLEWYAEPFISSGRYYDFGELQAPGSRDLRAYGTDGTTISESGDGTYAVTDGGQSFEINQSDFNVLSYRTNLVLRWEWSPGSTVFLVWQQNRSGFEPIGNLVKPSGLWDAMTAPGENFLAIKITYWIPFL